VCSAASGQAGHEPVGANRGARAVAPVNWRLLQTGAAAGAYNMALDEVLLERVSRGESGPLLRLYTWSPPCVSLGYGQRAEREVDVERCRREGVELVRRPTGGRAVLHWDELTYSVVCRQDDPVLGGDLSDTYRVIGECLLEGLSLLGVEASLERARARRQPPRGETASAPCFLGAARWEIKWAGRKLIGSAQRRWENAVLQHGSLLTGPGHERLIGLLPAAEARRWAGALAASSAHLGQCLEPLPAIERIRGCMAEGFGSRLGIQWDTAGVAAAEVVEAEQRAQEKINDPAWSARLGPARR
jgi:lipoyl(octanoyl) transferase